MAGKEIEQFFPKLQSEGYRITSPENENYNCIAYAAGDDTVKWDPDSSSGRYWPDEVPRTYELKSFVTLYRAKGGCEPCANPDWKQALKNRHLR